MAHWTTRDIPRQDGRLAIVTGANSGIGFETARLLADAGAEVVLACRSEERGQGAVNRILATNDQAAVRFEALDLSDLDSVKTFADRIGQQSSRLDLLINNAGVMIPPLTYTKQDFELQFGVNHLGHFALTGRLAPLLVKTPDATVVSVSSLAHWFGRIGFDDLQWKSRRYKKWAAYGQSKLANLLFAKELQRRFHAAGASTRSLAAHPGWTRTELQRNLPLADTMGSLLAMKPVGGALPTVRAALDTTLDGGAYIGPCGLFEVRGAPTPARTSARANDAALAARLWEESELLTGVTPSLRPETSTEAVLH